MDYFEKVRNIVAEQLNVDAETITMKTRFDELNADSLDVVEVIMLMLQAAQSRFHQQRTGFTAHRRHHFLLQHLYAQRDGNCCAQGRID